MSRKDELMYSALLHDIGKIISRSDGEEASHATKGKAFLQEMDAFKNKDFLENIAYHDKASLEVHDLASNSLAHIIAMANDITRGIDRKNDAQASGASAKKVKIDQPLHSIFNVIGLSEEEKENQIKEKQGVFPFHLAKGAPYPTVDKVTYRKEDYTALQTKLKKDLAKLPSLDKSYFASVLHLMEKYTTYIPHDVSDESLFDISLYDHSKITCAIATCLYDVLAEKNEKDYRKVLFSNGTKEDFYDKDLFLLTSLDMSGIQDFIYLISGSQALKSLRTRSFYIELMLEVIVDELLKRLNLSRANLLYTGGGHAYLLLPNTGKVKNEIEKFHKELKSWFLKEFTTDISASIAYEPCSGNDLMNENGNYGELWGNVTESLSKKKFQKYQLDDIDELNKMQEAEIESLDEESTRECSECLRSDIKIIDRRCSLCDLIIKASTILRDGKYFIVTAESKIDTEEKVQGDLKLPFDMWLTIQKNKELLSFKEDEVMFIYSKNNQTPTLTSNLTANLWMCDYDYAGADGIGSYVERVQSDQGIKRLGVMRADIDNLGMVFIEGIPEEYQSISRTTTLSRQLSVFFKVELTNILTKQNGSRITVIYSGGDDIFLIGAWDEVVEKAIEIRNEFEKFTLDKLTFSAGIGMFREKFPVAKMAERTGELEEQAKAGDKNQLTLWHDKEVYNWLEFEYDVLHDKVPFLHELFENVDVHGKAFVYKMLEYLQESTDINIARFAYLLARSDIPNEGASQLFEWIRKTEDRDQLITAIVYYVYQTREVN